MYEPLPKCVTIKNSPIHGLGLFATEFIPSGTEIGRSHFYFGETLERTPLGGFVNHSDNANCEKVQKDSRFFLTAIKDIQADEEVTLKYTFYSV
mgnify:CR=1 FL=1